MSIYDFQVKAQDGSLVSLADYKGKVILVVNTATGCGFTPQYEPLQALYDQCHDQGLEILDFPCNQFYGQAPGSDEEIPTFCTGRFGITFPQFSKIDVNGENADPLFKYLTGSTTFGGFGEGKMAEILTPIVSQMDPEYLNNGNIKWNFTKFLFDREGNLVARYEPTDDMDALAAKVKELL